MYTVTVTETIETTKWTDRSYEKIATDDEGKAVYGYPEQAPERTIETVKLVELKVGNLDVPAVITAVLDNS